MTPPTDQDGPPPAEDTVRTHRFDVPEMDCASCVSKVQKSLERLDGVVKIDASPTTGTLLVECRADVSAAAVRDRIEAAGYATGSDEATTTFAVPDMDCASCAKKVERALSNTDGVGEIETQPAAGQVTVTHDSGVSPDVLVSRIAAAGYDATAVGEERRFGTKRDIWRSRRGATTLAGAVLVVSGMVLSFAVPDADPLLFEFVGRTFNASHVLFIASAALAGAPIVRNGYYSARNLSLDIDFLMTAGIVGSVLTHHPFEGAMLAVLFSVAELLERYSMDRARGSLRELMELSPDTATVRRDGERETVPASRVSVGETVLVRPGEKIPLDGVIREGQSAVDQAPITGESVPVDRAAGEEVYAGTINEDGYLEIEVTSEASESTIARIVRMVETAQREKTDREQYVDRLAGIYTPVVVTAAVLVTLVPPLAFGAAWSTWFLRGLTLLVIACPCAFVISTPVSVVSGITSAARNGVLIKSGRDLEATGDIDVVALDKTGTVTTGELAVTDVITAEGVTGTELLRRASALERRSEHPIGEAIVGRANELEIDGDGSIDNFRAIAGKGIAADLDGVTHFVGNPGLFSELGFELRNDARRADGGETVGASSRNAATNDRVETVRSAVDRLEREGKSVVVVGTNERLYGAIAVADEPRPTARWAISKLRSQGIHVVMLTGDNAGVARSIAADVGIDEYHAELLPDEKLRKIEELEAERGTVAMVGDGINDAPALATATVGIAMGAAGTDTAIETADIALMGDDLTRLPYLHRLSRTANGVIRQNIWSSLGVKALLAIGAPFGIVTIVHAVVIGDMGMSLAVTGNAMRLSDVTPEAPDGPAG